MSFYLSWAVLLALIGYFARCDARHARPAPQVCLAAMALIWALCWAAEV